MEKKVMILLVIVAVAIQVTCGAKDVNDCCLRCAAKCIAWRDFDFCYKPCCACCHRPSCPGPPPSSKGGAGGGAGGLGVGFGPAGAGAGGHR